MQTHHDERARRGITPIAGLLGLLGLWLLWLLGMWVAWSILTAGWA